MTERMRINSSGNVGIGTTTIGGRLTVKSIGNDTWGVQVITSGSNSTIGGIYQSSAGDRMIAAYLADGATNNVRLNSNGDSWLTGGNVGIGTTSPIGKFDVGGPGGIYINPASTYPRIYFNGTAGSGVAGVVNMWC